MAELTFNHARAAYELGDAKVYTMRQLNQNTARVIAEINHDRRPAAITKQGRFVAIITPLEDYKVESLVLSRADHIVTGLAIADDEEVPTLTSEQVAAELRIDLSGESR